MNNITIQITANVSLPDGAIVNPDNTIIMPDGSVIKDISISISKYIGEDAVNADVLNGNIKIENLASDDKFQTVSM